MIRPHFRGILLKDRRIKICLSTTAVFLCLFALISYVGSAHVQANVNASNHDGQQPQVFQPVISEPEEHEVLFVGRTARFVVKAPVEVEDNHDQSLVQAGFTFPKDKLRDVHAQDEAKCAEGAPSQIQICSQPVPVSDLLEVKMFTFTGMPTRKALPELPFTVWVFAVEGDRLHAKKPFQHTPQSNPVRMPPPPKPVVHPVPPPPPPPKVVVHPVPPKPVVHLVPPPPPPKPVVRPVPPRVVPPPVVPPRPVVPRPVPPALPKTGSDPNAPPVP
jgi:hypothetical protein